MQRPFSQRFADFYFTTDDPFSEAKYNFIDGCGLLEGPLSLSIEAFKRTLRIGELGLGTGVNFITTIFYWRHFINSLKNSDIGPLPTLTSDISAHLHYHSIELYPLPPTEIIDYLRPYISNSSALGDLSAEFQIFMDLYQVAYAQMQTEGLHHTCAIDPHNHISLYVSFVEVAAALETLKNDHSDAMHAWYLDGFAPARNPDMWSEQVCQSLAELSAYGAKVATFSSAGAVKRNLTKAGFIMHKNPGFGTKRQRLIGLYQN